MLREAKHKSLGESATRWVSRAVERLCTAMLAPAVDVCKGFRARREGPALLKGGKRTQTSLEALVKD